METLLGWINSNELEKLRDYIKSLSNMNSVLIYDEETDLNLLHIISANDSLYRDDALRCLLEENDKSLNKPKLDINRKSGRGNDYWTACHLASCYGNASTLEILLDNGADPELIDKNGLDSLQIATAFDQYRCVELIRRKMKTNTFSKADLNKSCDTVFYSFKDVSRLENSYTVKKVDVQVQTSGQFNNTFDSTFKTTSNVSNDKTITNRSQNYSSQVVSRASKVLDRHRKDSKSTKILNSTLIDDHTRKSNVSRSLSKTAIFNEMRKDLSSPKSLASRSVGNKLKQSNSSTLKKSSNVIKNLRNDFKSCKNSNTTDNSIEPFDDSISTIVLSDTKTIYVDNEFRVGFLNETSPGLIDQLETSDSELSDLQLSDEFMSRMTEDCTLNGESNDQRSDEHDGNTFTCFKSTNHRNYDLFDDNQLFDELTRLGQNPGPINANTRSVYIKKLREISKQSAKLSNEISLLNNSLNELKIKDNTLMFSKPLRELMTGKFDFKLARQLELEFEQNFENDRASSKKFFNYLLLDPRVTQNLCKKALEDNPQLISWLNRTTQHNSASKDQSIYHFNFALFKLFILAIFYIGKGQGNRPYMHLYDAAKSEQMINSKKRSNIMKLNKIREVWRNNFGIVSLHCFQNASSIESLTRECLMIDTIGIKFLTNIQIGQNQIKNLKWTQYKRDMLGAYFLYKAFNVLLLNGERQIKRADICKI